jgi:branched-chain amino acid transport system substrate-binding protein
MLALLWARADAARLERLGHQMLKYETYLVPTLAGMDAILGRYTARIRRDGDTKRLPTAARQDLLAWLGQRFFGAAWTPRDFMNWARGRARYQKFIRDYARLGGRVLVGTDALKPCAGFLYHEELHRLRACGLSSAAVLRAATAAAAATLACPTRPHRAGRPGHLSPFRQPLAVWPTPGPSGPSSCAGESSTQTSCSPVPERKPREEVPMTMLRVLGVLLLAAMAAFPAGPAAAQDVVIGVAAPMTGNLAQIGKQFAEGAQLAADEVNARGGIKGAGRHPGGGRQGDPKEAATVAEVRPTTGPSPSWALLLVGLLRSNPIYTRAPGTITPSASTRTDQAGREVHVRMWSPISDVRPRPRPVHSQEARQEEHRRRLRAERLGHPDEGLLRQGAREARGARGGAEVVYDKDTDFKAQLTKVKAANPDALAILTYYTTGALLTLQARNLGINAPLVGTGTLYEDKFLEIAGKGNAEGLAVNTEFNADDPAPVVKNFVAMYQKLHPNEKPEPYHATTYDAARIILSAIEKAGTDRDAIRGCHRGDQ